MPRKLLPPDPDRPPLTDEQKKLLEQIDAGLVEPPFLNKRSRFSKSKVDIALTGLQQARAEAAKQAGWVHELVFNDWLKSCVEDADDPRQWTQSRVLYENYLAHARTVAKKYRERRLALQELATETQWGRWMATRYPKKRRTAGWYYPLRLPRSG